MGTRHTLAAETMCKYCSDLNPTCWSYGLGEWDISSQNPANIFGSMSSAQVLFALERNHRIKKRPVKGADRTIATRNQNGD